MEIRQLHHASVPVRDVERAKAFYRDVLGLEEIERPPFDFGGAWFAVGEGQLHLIQHPDATFRDGKGIDSRDTHLAIRVASFRAALERLRAHGYDADAEHDLQKLRVRPDPTAGFPQIHLLDPDRNVVEINAETSDL
ncbi:MAG: VOC family protein [Actinomycetota bacterium]|nr:VOC family protein [Actinomycetota bacterium]